METDYLRRNVRKTVSKKSVNSWLNKNVTLKSSCNKVTQSINDFLQNTLSTTK